MVAKASESVQVGVGSRVVETAADTVVVGDDVLGLGEARVDTLDATGLVLTEADVVGLVGLVLTGDRVVDHLHVGVAVVVSELRDLLDGLVPGGAAVEGRSLREQLVVAGVREVVDDVVDGDGVHDGFLTVIEGLT